MPYARPWTVGALVSLLVAACGSGPATRPAADARDPNLDRALTLLYE